MNDTVSPETGSVELSAPVDPDKAKLIPLAQRFIAGHSERTVSTRKLHGFLGVGRDFSNWIRDRIKRGRFVENQDYIVCSPKRASKARGGHNAKDYYLTLDMAKILGMLENNEKGDQIRRYFIACERELRERHAREQPKALPSPEPGLSKALRQAVNRKAYALSLQGFDRIRTHLTDWAEQWNRQWGEETAARKLESYGGDAGEMVFVSAETLWGVCSGFGMIQVTVDNAMRQIDSLERETGREWFNRV